MPSVQIGQHLGPFAAPSFNLCQLPCHHFCRPEPCGTAFVARQQGRGDAQPSLKGVEVPINGDVPVLSFLTGLQGRLDLRCVSVPARVQRPLVMGLSARRTSSPRPLRRNSVVTTFFPCRCGHRHSSRDKKVPPVLSSPREGGAPVVASGLLIAIEAARTRARDSKTEKEHGDHRHLQKDRQ